MNVYLLTERAVRFCTTRRIVFTLCLFATGVATQSATAQSTGAPPVNCGDSIDADIYIMLDRTGSTDNNSRTNERNASKVLLDFFDEVLDPPKVAIGAFGCNGHGFPGGRACTLQSLSNNENPPPYGDNDGNSDGDHYAAVDKATATESSTGTHYVDALNAVNNELDANGAASKRILIFLSDGGDQDSFAATTAAADALKQDTEVFAILFESATESDETVLRAIATDSNHFFAAPNSNQLMSIVETITDLISCDDGDPCTVDACVDGLCQFTPKFGACCFADGACMELRTSSQCHNAGGNFLGPCTDCSQCPPLTPGACCRPDGSCVVVSQPDCDGEFRGPGTDCSDNDGDGFADICFDRCLETEPEAIEDGRVTTDGCSILTCLAGGPYTAPCLPVNPGIVDVQLDGSAYGQVLNASDPRFGVTTSVWTTDSPFITFVDATDPKTIMRVDTAGLGCPADPVEITLNCTFTEIAPPGPLIPGDIILQTSDTTTVTTVVDCNGNGIDDAIDILSPSDDPCLSDCNNNGVPDCCDVDPSDPDNNGEVSDDNVGIVNGEIVQQPDGVPDECLASACCFLDGSCAILLPPDCTTLNGSPVIGQTCEQAACQVPPPGPRPCCFENCPCEVLEPDVCTARGGIPQLSATTCEEAACHITPCDDGDPCTEDVCVDGRCQYIPIDDPTPCCLPDGSCQVLPCSAACDAMGGTPTDSCHGSTTVSLLPTAVFRTPVTICGGGASCPAALAGMIVGLGSLRIGIRRRRRRGNR